MQPLIPQVSGSLLLGNYAEATRDRVAFLIRVAREYGDIAAVRMGAFRVTVISSAELAQALLVENDAAFVKGFGLSIFAKPLLGHGLLTSEHELHKRQRRMIAPAFMHKRISGYADTIVALTEQHVQQLRRRTHVDLAEEMMQLTFEIVGKTLFNADVRGDAKDVGEAVTTALESFTAQFYSRVPLPPSVPTPTNLRYRSAIRRLDDVVYRLIRERRAQGIDQGDLLSMLLLAQDEADGSGMSDQQVRDEVMTAMLAGHETTANALSWAFYLLSRHPAQRERLEAELDEVLGGRMPTVQDLPKLPYALQVFKETLRLYPPAYIIARRATRDVELGPYKIGRGQLVALDIVGMQRRDVYFEEPDSFDPDRFAPAREKQQKKGAYAPFGGGSRVCIGNHFALMEGQLALAHLAQHLRFDAHADAPAAATEALITMRPRGGLPMMVRPRTALVRPGRLSAMS
ncbi:MAG: cytochrome [Myxococcaceae bacterium]|nr:cytochrome [Myxococcaceae bacterium]